MPNISEIYKTINPKQTGLAAMIKLRERNLKSTNKKELIKIRATPPSHWAQTSVHTATFEQLVEASAATAPEPFLVWNPATETVLTATTNTTNNRN